MEINTQTREDQLILVDKNDKEIGECAKLEAHEKGLLHRAFSIFIFRKILVDNPDGTRTFQHQLLIQKRAADKYHSAGLWANSCCSHPRVGESLEDACARRLDEETGIKIADLTEPLEEKGSFLYKAELENGLTEHELDHVFVGWLRAAETAESMDCDDWPGRNPQEADEMKFVDVTWVMRDVLINANKYAAWFMPALMIASDGTEFESHDKAVSDRLIY